jgi:hypothetical protein
MVPRNYQLFIVSQHKLKCENASDAMRSVVRNASWKPLYDLRAIITEKKTEITIHYRANITQRTGEDWSDVELTLSTASPQLEALSLSFSQNTSGKWLVPYSTGANPNPKDLAFLLVGKRDQALHYPNSAGFDAAPYP